MTSPMGIFMPDPDYPAAARTSKIEGQVTLWVVVTKEGGVSDIAVVAGPVVFIPEALRAVRRWKIRPAQLQGEPVAAEITVEVAFHMR